MIKSWWVWINIVFSLNPQAPVAKNCGWGGFRRFQREALEFFKIGPHWPPSDFWCASFEKYQFKPFQISFFSDFHMKIMFWVRWFYSLFERMKLKRKKSMFMHTNWPLITSFYIKMYLFFDELAISQRWSAIFCASGAWGGIPIGRVRVKSHSFE